MTSTTATPPPPLLQVQDLCMRFGGLKAIDDLSLDVAARRIFRRRAGMGV